MTEGSPPSVNHGRSNNNKNDASILTENSHKLQNYNTIDEEKKFKFALKFFRDFDGKAFTPSYDNRNKLVALSLQVKYGKFVPDKAPGAGALDLVGRDRRTMWQILGDVSRDQAMKQFVELLSDLCPLFSPYIQAHMSSESHKENKSCAHGETSIEIHSNGQEASQSAHSHEEEEDLQKGQIQSILNEQTYQQFSSYAEMQYPGQVEKQTSLIKQLQELHYQQYMQQVLQQQFQQNQESKIAVSSTDSQSNKPLDDRDASGNILTNRDEDEVSQVVVTKPTSDEAEQVKMNGKNPGEAHVRCDGTVEMEKACSGKSDGVKCDSSNDGCEGDELVLATAQMWTRQEIESFRESIRKDGNEGQIKIGHGEVVTIQVPTHPEGSSIFWEFCTDSYDIAFGLLFEWTDDPGTQVSVHVSDDSEDSDEDDLSNAKNGVESLNLSDRDTEIALNSSNSDGQSLPQTEVLIPICRRDSHVEVYTGSHVYPGRGKYLLKFDNSYSMLRSKNLYYRVYYTR